MSHAADRARPNPVWLLVVVVMIGLAVAGPVIIVRDQLADDPPAAPTAAKGAQPVAAAAGEGTVKMAGLSFAPGTLTVARGTTVVFDNDDTAPTRSRPAPAGSTRACSTREGSPGREGRRPAVHTPAGGRGERLSTAPFSGGR
jgi:hypothetical protein